MKPGTPPLKSARLLDQVKERIRYLHYSLKTERAYLYWIRFFIRWMAAQGAGMRHPRDRMATTNQAHPICIDEGRNGWLASPNGWHYSASGKVAVRYRYALSMEGMRLRVKDVDFHRHVVIVREAKGNKDRVVMLPRALAPALRQQMLAARA
jgi:integrase